MLRCDPDIVVMVVSFCLSLQAICLSLKVMPP